MRSFGKRLGQRFTLLAVFFAAAGFSFVAGPTDNKSPSASPSETTLRLPAPVVFDGTVGPDQAVTFRHESHADASPGNCLACHPEPFKMLHPARATTHEAMNAGRSCGVCHNGHAAFGVEDADACARCHAGRGGAS